MDKQEIVAILKDDLKNDWLFKKADEVRQKNVGNAIHLRALIEFSNICKRHCKYCGIRAGNTTTKRYRLSEEEILFLAKKAVDLGYKTIVLQSGEDDDYYADKLCDIIRGIKAFDVAVTLSIGEKTFEEYKAYRQAGADRFLLRIETTDRNLYEAMHPRADFDNRVRCLHDLKTLGYEVGTGCLVGLPGQSLESLANDILFFKQLDADMIGVGPFIPHAQTPLKDEKQGNFWLALKVMALTRINLPTINIPATTAMETLMPNGRFIALQSGANVVMPNVSTVDCRKKYEIYPNKAGVNDNEADVRKQLEIRFATIGRTLASDKGFRRK